ncbi:hypothetical protein AGABI1DRAFT_52492 [Agaricus bisporus var. burnettii JB137-S8]|uniref:Zn(2)-C6 fungal-type domain-containing protein n=1 Tax=Agaricus bisporus var. burnettii (strain JB137-S8 / ATCC MYA-4627 / FGSC 10392) TaxID=597362 RepID=K5Y369_AGABU|nr:uncharacterized protein AGABI1DRAFT_52492 [Agaricus bisporus var. burnettii JB137-S8]EKM82370.1 hypothetical protein AGABI1DRAFT_52492 [Agaricus bisporus var. burnettii JB137-S8]
MPPPQSPPMPIDPALTLYPPYYQSFQQQQQQQNQPSHLPHHLQNYSSPSSQGSDTLGTPPTEHNYPSPNNANGKRPASVLSSHGDIRKRPRKDEDEEAASPKVEPKAKSTRGSKACTVCRRLKMKCIGAEQGPPCKRCITGGHECIFEESHRGKRSSKKHELLSQSLHKIENVLNTVLKSIGNPSIVSGMISRSPTPSAQNTSTQALLAKSPSPPPTSSAFSQPPPGSPKLHSLPDNSLNPLGLLAEASLANRRAQVSNNLSKIGSAHEGQSLGVASDNYFKPGPMTILPLRRLYIERQIQPEMLSFVTTDEVVALFDIYFDHISMHCSLLDRNFHTPSLVCSRSPFLLTTICSIASKFYTANPDLHPKLTELAKKLAFSVPAKGYKSVEIVQAYLLLSLWGCGAVERYEQDKTWLLLGMAIRMATDLNLHRKTAVTSQDTAEGKARDIEVHNRERTWILCFCLDRSFSAQMGKPHSIIEDYIIRHAPQWAKSPTATPSDLSVCAYAQLQRILSRSLDFLYSGTDSSSGLQTHCDYLLIIKSFEAQLTTFKETWYSSSTWEGEKPGTAEYKRLIASFYFNYANLVINSFGLQDAFERTPVNIGHFFGRVHDSAMACALLVRDHLGPSGFMKYSPDSHFVQTSYAVLSLLKLVRPEFQAFMEDEQKTLSLVRDVAGVLLDIAATPSHTPALYATFLKALISAKLEPQLCQQPVDHSSNMLGSPDPGTVTLNNNNNNNNNNANPTTTTGGGGYYHDPSSYFLNEFQFEGEMGPVQDITTFPPTMVPQTGLDDALMMENILSSGFWDSMLPPGYNSMDGISGGFVYGAGGSGMITPRFGISPINSGMNTPGRSGGGQLQQQHQQQQHQHQQSQHQQQQQNQQVTQSTINAAFDQHGRRLVKSDV